MTVDELQVLITANTSKLQAEMDKANKNIKSLQDSANKSQKGVTTAFTKLKQGIVALGIGKVIKDSIQMGMDAIESDSLFETSLGNMADSVRAWSDEVAGVLGLSAVAMRKNTGVIYNMTTSMGLAEDNALKMSKGISLLSEDMASFYNLNSTEAFNKLRAGLTGETEPLKALGILVDENTIKQVAYQEGIATVGSELTQQQKVLARYVAILKQTGNAQGDLARTIDSPANQLRILKNQVTQLGLAFSNFLMPIVGAVLPYLNAFAKVVTTAINSLSKFLGLSSGSSTKSMSSGISSVNTGLSGVNDNLGKANKNAKKLKGNLAGFDEMNVLQDNSSNTSTSGATGSGTGGVGGDLGFDLSEYDAHLDSVSSKADEIAEKIRGVFSNAFKNVDFTNLITNFNMLKESLAPFIQNVGAGLKWFLDNVLAPLITWSINDVVPAFLKILSGAIDLVNNVITDVKPIFQWFWDKILVPIGKWTGGVIVKILNGIGDALKWIGNNEVAISIIEGVAIAIGIVTLALELYTGANLYLNTIMGIGKAIASGFGAVMSFITSPITLVTVGIGLLVAGIILLIKNWDTVKEVAKNVWNKVKEIWGVVADWFNKNIVSPVKNFFSSMWDNLKTGAKNSWNGIKSVFSTVANFFQSIFSTAWSKVKAVFSTGGKIFDGIKEGISNAFKTVVNGLIGGINKIVSVPFNAINSMLNKIRNTEVMGISPFKNLWKQNPLSVPQIPKLAQGGIVNKPTYAMIGEAGKEAVMPLERNTGWIDQLADKLNTKGGNGQQHITIKLGEDTIFDKFIDYTRSKSFETNGEVFAI